MGVGAETEGAGPSDETAALDFDMWADLSAQLLHRDMDERIDILEERGVTLEDWSRCDEQYATALAADIAAGRMARAESYGRRCAAEMQRRKQQADTSREDGEAKGGETTPADPAPAPLPVPTPEPVVPTFLQDLRIASTPPAVPRQLAGTISADSLPSFVKQAATKPLPFREKPSAELVASANAPKPPLSGGLGATIGVDGDLASQVRAALPFAKQDDGARRPGGALVGETAALDVALVAQGAGGLPFPTSAGGVARPRAPSFPRLPLQTYASLYVELSLFPDRAAEVLTKYGVKDEAARRALEQDWQTRFTAHEDTRQEWVQACATYREWLLRQPR